MVHLPHPVAGFAPVFLAITVTSATSARSEDQTTLTLGLTAGF